MDTYNKIISHLLIIDSSLDNIHNIVKNLKNNIYYILIDNYDIDNIKNKIKQLNTSNLVYCVLSNNISYFENLFDNEINIINSNNYDKYFNFDFNYEENITIYYNEKITIDKLYITFLGGVFTIDSTIDSQIDKDNGIIIINANKIGNYNLLIKYTFANFTVEKNINVIIKPIIKYNKLIIESINPIGGIFYLDSNDFKIDNKTGEITIINNIVGIHELNIKYIINEITTFYNNTIEIKPNVKYPDYNIIIYYNENYISKLPIINSYNGLFTISNKDIIIDQLTGQFTINNFMVNTYKFNINYTLNNITLIIDFILIVKSKVTYINHSITYLEKFISDKPLTTPEGGRYFCLKDDVIINNYNGIIELNNLKVDNYYIPINYYYNNTHTITNLNLIVRPILNYIYPKNNTFHDITSNYKSYIPIINPDNGIFTINSDIITINNQGIIDFTNFNLIGSHEITVNYSYNNISSEFIYKFSKSPELLINSYYEFDYNDNINILLNDDGVFEIDNDNFSINNNYLINNNLINVGKYSINVKYINNNIIVNKLIIIIIKPKIKYDTYEIIINDNNIYTSNYPIIEPNNGTFTCSNNILINDGQIIIDPFKYYQINDFIIYYKVNDIVINSYFKLIVNPYFKYIDTSFTIPNKIDYYSDIPLINRNDGIFSVNNNLIIINENGQLYFNKTLEIGNYYFDIIYKINNLIYTEKFNVTIKPTISYPLSQINVIYGKYYESEPININTNYISTFNINDTIEGITINSNNGILKVNNTVPIGKYIINVSYNYNDIITSTIITIIVVPDVIYNSLVNTISYKDNYQSQQPLTKPNNGTFKLINNNNISIDNNGIIHAKDLDINVYNFIIQYKYNNIIREINYSIICNPIINYLQNTIEINYGKGGESIIPDCLPNNGTFKLKENILGISIKNNGLLIFDPTIFIGNYKIEIIYQVYDNIVTTNYNLIVKPTVIYEDAVFTYNNLITTNKPITNFDDGIFKLLNNDHATINKNSGILTLIDIEPGNYIFNIEYIKNNISVITNLNVLIKPKIDVENNYVYIYKTNNNIIPLFYPKNGIIKVNGENSDGIINTYNLNIDNYIYNIDYIYNNITTSIKINILIKSNLYYEFNEYIHYKNNIIYPKNYENIGEFQSDDIIINSDGSVNISNLDVGDYMYNIKYIINKIITIIELKFRIIPDFYYNYNTLNLFYLTNNFNIGKPYISCKNNTSYFELMNDYYLKIDKFTGEIIIVKILPIGKYYYDIYYYINNISTKYTINININPFISYKNTNIIDENGAISVKYNKTIYINKPKIEPDYGIFKYELLDGLIFNNDGSIISNKNINVGDYMLIIYYKIDNNETISYIRLMIYPEINYINNNIIKLYDDKSESEYPIINSSGQGIFTSLNDIIIDNNTGKLFFDKNIPVGKHNYIINYELNNITIEAYFNLTVIPSIKILNDTFYLKYKSNTIIDAPIVKPEGGLYSLYNNYYKLKLDNGLININNLYPGYYEIKLIYTYNNLSSDVTYKIYIKPNISYSVNDIIIYKSNYISNLPILEPKLDTNAKISILNNNNSLTKNGEIIFDSFNVGEYNIKVEYCYNNQSEFTIVNFNIIPKIYYSKTKYEMNYNTILYSVIPEIEPKGLIFKSDLIIDNDGKITFKDFNPGIYEFIIYYGLNSVKINLIVKPVFTYNQNNIIKNYGDELFIYPINNLKGIFSCNDEEINIDFENGFINLENIYPCDKNITIFYNVNSVISQYSIKILCYPIIDYYIKETIMKYNEVSYSVIPIIKPKNGKFNLNKSIDNIKINNLGIILFEKPNVGKYNFDIIYAYNDISVKVNYNLLVHPIFYYNNDIFYYNQKIISNIPIINPSNGIIYCNDKSYTVTKKGEIITNINNINDYSLKVYYKVNNFIIDTIYNFSIIPNIIYKDFIIKYNSDIKVSPDIITPSGGTFKIKDYDIYIDNNGSFNIYGLEPNNYNINIIYNYNNKDYNYYIKLKIDLYLEYIDNKLIYLPLGGNLKYDNNIFTIDENNKVILNNQQLGNYNLYINYTYNNIISDLYFNVSINTKLFYENTNIDIFYDENIIINPLIDYGKYKSNVNYIIINENGQIILKNVPIGIYNFIIEYENNNYYEKINFTINIKPKAIFNDIELECINYTITPSFMSSINGIFNFSVLYNNIQYYNNGTIKLFKPKPNNYNINYKYIVNQSEYNGTFNIKIKPNIKFNKNKIIKKYSEVYIDNTLNVYPIGGNFKCNHSDIILNYNYFEINKEKSVGDHDVELYYSYNDQINCIKVNLIIEPQIYYSINTIKLSYYDNIKSVKPFINPFGGIFSMETNINGVNIDELSGVINLHNVEIGIYKLTINYKYNDIISKTNYNVHSIPILYYNQNLSINYSENYNLFSEKPIVYPLNGKFSIINNNIINEDTGIIQFNNLSVGLYDININYIYNNIKLNTIYKFIVKPNIYFDESLITISYNTHYECTLPQVSPSGGIFSCDNLPISFYINKTNGKITIYKINDVIKNGLNKFIIKNVAYKGNYKLIINYMINNVSSSTNLFINII